ncbi:PREDICTED: tubulointerstitial nephritis antigen-like, partial [Tinamus guttatus]|uniref:tubulointerstitial nephritis antigen-like n=1 Tax=Tinamus guttatus TaxID=94827 RepID=UPI00052EBCEA
AAGLGDTGGIMRLLCALLILLPEAAASRTRRELAPGLYEHGVYDAGGSYCERGDVCCRGRDDGCTVPYLDTICYCDLFCNRTVSDCCPDFWEYCLGIPPPFPKTHGCTRAGRNYPSGATYRENCNLCTCSQGGRWDCEDHACLMDPELITAINSGNFGPGSIHEPLDQGNCAGSWAFSTAAVASDRISIHSMGHMTPALSPQNLLSCDTRNQRGCGGGGTPSRSPARGKRQATAHCPNPRARANDIYQATPAYRLAADEKEIMKELMENGPVQ